MDRIAVLASGVRRIFWGYFFLLLDFNLNFFSAFTLPLLPDLAGWVLLWTGIRRLTPLRPSLGLLVPFCLVLGVCSLTQFVPWLEAFFPGWLSLLLAILHLYTDFQLITDLAALSDQTLPGEPYGRRLRTARTFIVVTQTAMYCYDLLLQFTALSLLVILVGFCAALYLLWQLGRLSRRLRRLPPE